MSEKRLVRGEKKIGGICSGIADYFGWDPSWVRIAFLASTLFYGLGFWLYFVCAVVMPNE